MNLFRLKKKNFIFETNFEKGLNLILYELVEVRDGVPEGEKGEFLSKLVICLGELFLTESNRLVNLSHYFVD